jgi:hypothetical protein
VSGRINFIPNDPAPLARRRLHRTSLAGVAPNAQKVVVRREVSLTGLSERLAGVVAIAPQP